jgi:hypothetical protein
MGKVVLLISKFIQIDIGDFCDGDNDKNDVSTHICAPAISQVNFKRANTRHLLEYVFIQSPNTPTRDIIYIEF